MKSICSYGFFSIFSIFSLSIALANPTDNGVPAGKLVNFYIFTFFINKAHFFAEHNRNPESREVFRTFLDQPVASGRLRSQPALFENPGSGRSENLRMTDYNDANPITSEGVISPVEPESQILASSIRLLCQSGFMTVAVEKESLNSNFEIESEGQVGTRNFYNCCCRF